uniref:Uncharacterized protein n=1 Tax=Trichuris muris TaxID=70415 RepID=A0A5S6QPH2_TRIMR
MAGATQEVYLPQKFCIGDENVGKEVGSVEARINNPRETNGKPLVFSPSAKKPVQHNGILKKKFLEHPYKH